MKSWENLLTNITIIRSPSPNTEKELQVFESNYVAKLPKEYRDYCKVWGSGDVNELISVCCISHTHPTDIVISEQLSFKEVFELYFTDQLLSQEQINSLFVFGFAVKNQDL